ncbi:hypothetical protein Cpir12675_001818 [Ceratocystis pirilliformis]|uniref:Zn(2)-C6 fungal-type domain-containing protein n=1 Tax=Ceratocystis pirilliformis TaxID=259994 RepID=A0ABR3ZDF6_9PEZI
MADESASPTSADDHINHLDDHSHHGDDSSRPRKRQRVRLSCLECRRRKLSCDRGFPCQRCTKSGTPERCQYESQDGTVLDASTVAATNMPVSVPVSVPVSMPVALPVSISGPIPSYAPTCNGAATTSTGSPGLPRLNRHLPDPDAVLRDPPRDLDRIRKMEYEIAALKTQLARQAATSASLECSMTAVSASAAATPGTQKGEATASGAVDTPERTENGTAAQNLSRLDATQPGDKTLIELNCPDGLLNKELRFFRGKEFRTRYFGPANATMAFSELNGLCPFMKETAEEWLKPARLQERKDKRKRQDYQDVKFAMPDPSLEALLPSRSETDALVSCYLDQFEQLHRIMHIPTFLREYKAFWDGPSVNTKTGSSTAITAPGRPVRPAAMTALVLAMLAVSSSLYTKTPVRFIGVISTARHSAGRWIEAVERWHGEQSYKHRRLVHYQISCLLYLSKRINIIKKKRFWTGSGSLIQEGIAVGLHRDPAAMNNRISPYNQEMRRRIWATMQEFDMQAAFDYGLPTLLSQVHSDVAAPANLDDDQFDEDSIELPPSRPIKEYTYSSYQHLSRQSLPLRLELSRILSGPPGETEYDMVIRYTNDLTQEIDALPSWEAAPSAHGSADSSMNPSAAKKPLLAYTLLHIQLRQYILPLHQPYLKLRTSNSKYQYSEIIYYNAARDMVLLHEKLFEQGVRTLNFLREDALTMTINLCSVTLLQPRGSTNMIMINAPHTVKLLQKCIEMKRDRLLRCGNNEPWGFCIMCSALGLLQTHLGAETAEKAKLCASEHFMNLHYTILANQVEGRDLEAHALPQSEPIVLPGLQSLPYPLGIDISPSSASAAATAAAVAMMTSAQPWPPALATDGSSGQVRLSCSDITRPHHQSRTCRELHSHQPSSSVTAISSLMSTSDSQPGTISSSTTAPSTMLSLPGEPLFSPSPSPSMSPTVALENGDAAKSRCLGICTGPGSSATVTAAAGCSSDDTAVAGHDQGTPLLRPLLNAQAPPSPLLNNNADFSLELLGLNFNEIWGDSWNSLNGS